VNRKKLGDAIVGGVLGREEFLFGITTGNMIIYHMSDDCNESVIRKPDNLL